MGTRSAAATSELTFGRAPRLRGLHLSRDWAVRIVAFVGFLTAWEAAGRIFPRLIFAGPGRTMEALQRMVNQGQLQAAWAESLGVLITALALAAVSGVALGVLLGRFVRLDRFLEPILTALFMTPRIALLPIIALWLGFQDPAKILVVFLFSFFEILFTVRNGVRTIDAEYVEVARSYNIDDWTLLRKVILPASTPYVITGLRLGLLHGMVGIVLAGFFLENNGIGGLISNEAESIRVHGIFAALLTVAAVGVALNQGLRWLERRAAPWREGWSG